MKKKEETTIVTLKREDISTKRITLEVLEDLFRVLDRVEADVKTTYGRTGNQIPKTEWNAELEKCVEVVDEDGNVVMKDEWGDMPKKEEDFTDDDRAKLKAIAIIKTELEKLI